MKIHAYRYWDCCLTCSGHINLHKTQTPPGDQTASAHLNPRTPQLNPIYRYPYSRNSRSQRPGSSHSRAGRVARTGPRNHSLVLNNSISQRPHAQEVKSAASPGSTGASQSQSGYISKHGRHKQLINSSIYDKESQKRIKALETTQQQKASARNQWERNQMQQYIRKLDVDSNRSQVYASAASGQNTYQIQIDGLNYSVLNNGSKLARVFGKMIVLYPYCWLLLIKLGPFDKVQSTPKRATLHGVVFLRSKNGNLYRSGAVRAKR